MVVVAVQIICIVKVRNEIDFNAKALLMTDNGIEQPEQLRTAQIIIF